MTNWIDLTNFAIVISGLTVTILGFILALVIPYTEKWHRRFFITFFALLIAYTGSDLLSQIS